MSRMSELDLEIRDAIESGATWEEVVRIVGNYVPEKALAIFAIACKIWEEYNGPGYGEA